MTAILYDNMAHGPQNLKTRLFSTKKGWTSVGFWGERKTLLPEAAKLQGWVWTVWRPLSPAGQRKQCQHRGQDMADRRSKDSWGLERENGKGLRPTGAEASKGRKGSGSLESRSSGHQFLQLSLNSVLPSYGRSKIDQILRSILITKVNNTREFLWRIHSLSRTDIPTDSCTAL